MDDLYEEILAIRARLAELDKLLGAPAAVDSVNQAIRAARGNPGAIRDDDGKFVGMNQMIRGARGRALPAEPSRIGSEGGARDGNGVS